MTSLQLHHLFRHMVIASKNLPEIKQTFTRAVQAPSSSVSDRAELVKLIRQSLSRIRNRCNIIQVKKSERKRLLLVRKRISHLLTVLPKSK